MIRKIAVAVGLASMAFLGAHTAGTAADAASILKSVDKDNDGTIDLGEARAAGMAHFEKIDTDHDGTVDKAEAKADNVGAAAFSAADPDKDGTVDKTEFGKIIDKSFKKADRDNDGTVSADELKAPAGKGLLSVIR